MRTEVECVFCGCDMKNIGTNRKCHWRCDACGGHVLNSTWYTKKQWYMWMISGGH